MFRPIMTGHVQVGIHIKLCQGYCQCSAVKIFALKNLGFVDSESTMLDMSTV